MQLNSNVKCKPTKTTKLPYYKKLQQVDSNDFAA